MSKSQKGNIKVIVNYYKKNLYLVVIINIINVTLRHNIKLFEFFIILNSDMYVM